jgi:hypothetical protein
MILQELKKMYPRASEEVLMAVKTDLEKLRGKDISASELAERTDKLVTAHTIEKAINTKTEDDSKPRQIGDESSFDIMEVNDEGNN